MPPRLRNLLRNPGVLALGGTGAVLALLLLLQRRRGATPPCLKDPNDLPSAQRARVLALAPDAQVALLGLLCALDEIGQPYVVGDTLRTPEEQAEHIRAGRSANPNSLHLRGFAVDIYLMDPTTGEIDWGGDSCTRYEAFHAIAARFGFRALGCRTLHTADGRAFTDPYHLELPA